MRKTTKTSEQNERAATEARGLVRAFFDGDVKKTDLWFNTKNPILFGNIKPIDLIRSGRADKVLQVVKLQLAENVDDELQRAKNDDSGLSNKREEAGT